MQDRDEGQAVAEDGVTEVAAASGSAAAGAGMPVVGAGLALSEELGRAWLQAVRALRACLHSVVDLDAPPATLRELADRAAALSADLRKHATGRAVPLYGGFDPAAPGSLLPFSPIMGAYNPMAPSLDLAVDGDRIVGRVRFGKACEGATNRVHGGLVSAVYDEVLALATFIAGCPGPTARLTVEYRKPTPIETDLTLESRIEERNGRKVTVRGRCRLGDEILSEGEAIFVAMAPGSEADWGP